MDTSIETTRDILAFVAQEKGVDNPNTSNEETLKQALDYFYGARSKLQYLQRKGYTVSRQERNAFLLKLIADLAYREERQRKEIEKLTEELNVLRQMKLL